MPVNPMAEKLLLIKSLGYLPNDIRWSGFRVCEQRAIIITPSGREFSPKELESFVFWRGLLFARTTHTRQIGSS